MILLSRDTLWSTEHNRDPFGEEVLLDLFRILTDQLDLRKIDDPVRKQVYSEEDTIDRWPTRCEVDRDLPSKFIWRYEDTAHRQLHVLWEVRQQDSWLLY